MAGPGITIGSIDYPDYRKNHDPLAWNVVQLEASEITRAKQQQGVQLSDSEARGRAAGLVRPTDQARLTPEIRLNAARAAFKDALRVLTPQ